jgi:pyruvate kinase
MVAMRAEHRGDIDYKKRFLAVTPGFEAGVTVTDAISHATCTIAQDLGAKAIIAVTKSGYTARMVSKYRPNSMIIATTIDERRQRQLSLSWGVTPLLTEQKLTTDELFDSAVDAAADLGFVENGDIVVITAGVPVGVSGTTNIVKCIWWGMCSARRGRGRQTVCGSLCVCRSRRRPGRNSATTVSSLSRRPPTRFCRS